MHNNNNNNNNNNNTNTNSTNNNNNNNNMSTVQNKIGNHIQVTGTCWGHHQFKGPPTI